MEEGWTRSKILILMLVGIGSLIGVSMYIYGISRWKDNPNAVYWLIGGFVIHILSLGVIPQILKRIWNKRG